MLLGSRYGNIPHKFLHCELICGATIRQLSRSQASVS
ncbi:unnamed protein product [Chondrus crispus]|uniref:Uncharacterized protein n=1 Tax=Chondrus crispus TaxID=2769 RepID=R7QBM4_CHOCR|nr:unnamed protein product [Chondrus crispus]CDF34826.1 unnamed protein product [Chondrus crispus]|eukprot:XP_005714645.1 unnamed protein product [Chondrus crispus]